MTEQPPTIVTVADATVAGDGAASPSRSRATLIVYEGEGDSSRTRLLPISDGTKITFGRSRTCVVHIDSERVSRTHAVLRRSGLDITIEDLNSRNGTRVNGRRIDGAFHLSSGDEIDVGPITAVVNVTSGMERHHALAEAREFDARLSQEADRSRRYRRSFALVMLNLRGDDQTIDDALDRLLAALRPMDTIAEYSSEEYTILLPEADLAAGSEAARELLRIARGAPPDSQPELVRAGLAVFPSHASQPGELLYRARAAVRKSTGDGASDVTVATSREPTPNPDELVVSDPQMQRVYTRVRKFADSKITVLILGETGAGKEVIAEALHRASGRRDAPFIRLNCASIHENLLESELFGHEKGAFTGADRKRIGYFEAARGGTLFLDEIGELSANLQAKLLRVLEQKRITRVGGTQEIEVDTRVVCATHRNLEVETTLGNFRKDLYFRICAVTVMVPSLRDRRGEIRPLSEYFARRIAREQGGLAPRFSDAAFEALERYHWPGNVRELRNAVETAYVLTDVGVIDLEHLPERVREAHIQPQASALEPGLSAEPPPTGVHMRDHINSIERNTLVATMKACNGNQTHAARKLGISRRSLIYKLEKYGLKKKPASRS
ncbi:MAG: hypothetical protein Tsb0020_10070 [Haliangiales bacterium]